MMERFLMPPQLRLGKKSKGEGVLGLAGNRRRKSSSSGSISFAARNKKKKIHNIRHEQVLRQFLIIRTNFGLVLKVDSTIKYNKQET